MGRKKKEERRKEFNVKSGSATKRGVTERLIQVKEKEQISQIRDSSYNMKHERV